MVARRRNRATDAIPGRSTGQRADAAHDPRPSLNGDAPGYKMAGSDYGTQDPGSWRMFTCHSGMKKVTSGIAD
jgi:hypothetical protein